nr:hypothetical protein [Brevibacterium casei]
MVGGSALKLSLDPCQFRAEAVLLFLEQVGGDGVLVVELEELALLVLQIVSGCLELRDAFALLGGREGDLLAQVLLELGALVVGQPDVPVEAFDLLLDLVDEDGFEVAVGAFGASADADEVRVEVAGAGGGHLHDEAGAAAAADDCGLEEVLVDAVVLAVAA